MLDGLWRRMYQNKHQRRAQRAVEGPANGTVQSQSPLPV